MNWKRSISANLTAYNRKIFKYECEGWKILHHYNRFRKSSYLYRHANYFDGWQKIGEFKNLKIAKQVAEFIQRKA